MGDSNGFLDGSSNNQMETAAGGGGASTGPENNELTAILSPSSPEICLLRDSPFRILRVSAAAYLLC